MSHLNFGWLPWEMREEGGPVLVKEEWQQLGPLRAHPLV